MLWEKEKLDKSHELKRERIEVEKERWAYEKEREITERERAKIVEDEGVEVKISKEKLIFLVFTYNFIIT